MDSFFEKVSTYITNILGSFRAFLIAFLIVILWVLLGPYFHFSDTWQLIINTATTVITFLMLFLLQNTANRTITELHNRMKEIEKINKDIERYLIRQRRR